MSEVSEPAGDLVEQVAERLAVRFSDWAILVLDVDENSPVLSRVCDEMRKEIGQAITAMPDRAALAGEVERLKRINSELVNSHNAMNLDGARLENELTTIRTQLAASQADVARLRESMEPSGDTYGGNQSPRRHQGHPAMTTMKQAEKRAAELTNAEAKMLCRHCPGELYGCHKFGWPDTGDDAFSRAGRVLMSAGLIQWAPNPRDSRTQLTRFGLAVRAAAIASREHRSASHDAD